MIRKAIVIGSVLCAFASIGASLAQAQSRGGGAPERFVLSGVILYEGGGLAWLQEPSLTGDRAVALRLSDSIGPYRLTKILDDRVELEGPTGTILVPVYNAQGSGSTVATAGPGVAPPGVPGTRQGRAAGPGPAPQSTASTQATPPGAQAVQNAWQAPGQQQPGQLTAPEQREASRAPATRPGVASDNPAGRAGKPSGPGGTYTQSDVIIAEKGQTFQSILGLK